jgi:hypothetical protein
MFYFANTNRSKALTPSQSLLATKRNFDDAANKPPS